MYIRNKKEEKKKKKEKIRNNIASERKNEHRERETGKYLSGSALDTSRAFSTAVMCFRWWTRSPFPVYLT